MVGHIWVRNPSQGEPERSDDLAPTTIHYLNNSLRFNIRRAASAVHFGVASALRQNTEQNGTNVLSALCKILCYDNTIGSTITLANRQALAMGLHTLTTKYKGFEGLRVGGFGCPLTLTLTGPILQNPTKPDSR